jgi:hypothetical protein
MGQASYTEIEVNMVKNAPLAYELQAVGDAMVKLIKDTPPELQPAALTAALAVVTGFQGIADAEVEALPDFPPSLSAENIKEEGNSLDRLYRQLPAGSSAQVFFAGLQLLSNVDEMVSPISNDAPTVPHQLSTSLINDQANKLREYIIREVGS